MELIFWIAVILILYAYIGYPIILYAYSLTGKEKKFNSTLTDYPKLTFIIPVYNEEKILKEKINNTLNLEYPIDLMEVIIVSDGSTDGTTDIMRQYNNSPIRFVEQVKRQGKASALNKGLEASTGEIVVFTDASILLTKSALVNILSPFENTEIGCVSGEDHILDQSGEGLYGRYELWIRNLESRCRSIVGASGCFYAQRKDLIKKFKAGRAPDFQSVLDTISEGKIAITKKNAIGVMGRNKKSGDEFNRKVRTILRGITALMDYKTLLNIRRHGFISFELWSHKILRWIIGLLMVIAFIANIFLIQKPIYAALFVLHSGFYILAIIGWIREKMNRKENAIYYRFPLYFCLSNFACLFAWIKYLCGRRVEIWDSTQR